jgi:phosphoribosylglycinamide formyltransferase
VDRVAPIVVKKIEWEGEDLEELKERMHFHEHQLIVKATAKVAQEIVETSRVRPGLVDSTDKRERSTPA